MGFRVYLWSTATPEDQLDPTRKCSKTSHTRNHCSFLPSSHTSHTAISMQDDDDRGLRYPRPGAPSQTPAFLFESSYHYADSDDGDMVSNPDEITVIACELDHSPDFDLVHTPPEALGSPPTTPSFTFGSPSTTHQTHQRPSTVHGYFVPQSPRAPPSYRNSEDSLDNIADGQLLSDRELPPVRPRSTLQASTSSMSYSQLPNYPVAAAAALNSTASALPLIEQYYPLFRYLMVVGAMCIGAAFDFCSFMPSALQLPLEHVRHCRS